MISGDDYRSLSNASEDRDSSLMSGQSQADNNAINRGNKRRSASHSSSSSIAEDEVNQSANFARPKPRQPQKTQSNELQTDTPVSIQNLAGVAKSDSNELLVIQSNESDGNKLQANLSQVTIAVDNNEILSKQEKNQGDRQTKPKIEDSKTESQKITLKVEDGGKPVMGSVDSKMTKNQDKTERLIKESQLDKVMVGPLVNAPQGSQAQSQLQNQESQTITKSAKVIDRSKDQTWRQLEELKSLDKVFPNPALTVGCYVQMQSGAGQPPSFGQVKSCKSLPKSGVQSASPHIADYQVDVQNLSSSTSDSQSTTTTHAANTLKYLARAYLCNLSELCADKMPASLLESLNITNQTTSAAAQEQNQDSNDQSRQMIVLIQTISTKAASVNTNESLTPGQVVAGQGKSEEKKNITSKGQDTAEQQPVVLNNESCLLSEGNSAHRLHALVARTSTDSKTNPGADDFILYPVVFKSTQNRGKKTARIPLKKEAPIDQDQEVNSLCYKERVIAQKSLQIARKLQKAFIDNYLAKVNKVELTKSNVADNLLSIVSFSEKKKDAGQQNNDEEMVNDSIDQGLREDVQIGIATNYKIVKSSEQKQKDQVLLFVTLLINAKPGRTTTWVPLQDSNPKIEADLSLGLVSQKWLEKLTVHDNDGSNSNNSLPNQSQSATAAGGKQSAQSQKQNQRQGNVLSNKLRQVQMLNWQESLAEKQSTLLLEKIKIDQVQESHHTDKARADGDISSECLSRKQVRPAMATNDTRASNCKKCNYITKLDNNPEAVAKGHMASSHLKVVMCSRCQGKYHERCLQPSERNISSAELNWRCPDCQRCSNCKSQQCRSQLLTCLKCNTPTHYDCLSQEYRQSLKPLYTSIEDPSNSEAEVKKLNLQVRRFRCEDCIKCQNCDTRVAGTKRHHKWSKDFKLCAQCNKMRDKRLFCPVCERFQPSEFSQHEHTQAITQSQQSNIETQNPTKLSSPGGKKLQGKEAEMAARNQLMLTTGTQILNGEKMIKCRQCTMLVHVDCDRMLSDPVVRKQILPDRVEGETTKMPANSPEYKCPNCRRSNRNKLLEDIIDALIKLDKQQHFLLPFWNQMQTQTQQAYLETIKRKPVCFSQIRSDIRSSKKYLLSPKDFWKDIERVFINAKAWNAVDVYNAAAQLHDKANTFIKNKKLADQVEINSKATMDESRFTLFMRKIAKDLRKGIVPSGSRGSLETQRPTEFKITAKEMLQGSEVPPLRAFNINNSVLEVIAQNSSSQQEASNLMLYQSSLGKEQNLQSQVVKKVALPAHKQWQKLMEDLQTNDERDKCWYSNPVKISFSDPALIFEEMCYLCGAFGNQDDFLCCNLCSESFHPYCLPYPKSNREQFQDYWRCYNCMFCEKCHSSKQWEGLLICAVCDKVDHFWCLEPQLIQVPECNWKCPECFKCAKCSTKSFFSEKDIENKVNMDRNEKFVLSFDFELCYQCGLDEYRKSFCSICNEKTGFGLSSVQGANSQQKVQAIASSDIPDDVSILKCNQCSFYSHLDCSKTDLGALGEHAETFNRLIKIDTGVQGKETAKSIYKCIDCLLIDRLPSYYIFQQCELYESLHQNMQKWNLLCGLLETILVPKFLHSVDNPSLYLTNFAQNNAKFFREDRLIQQWLALLDSAPQHNSPETQSCTDEHVSSIDNNKTTEVQQTGNNDVQMQDESAVGDGKKTTSTPEESKKITETAPHNIVPETTDQVNCIQSIETGSLLQFEHPSSENEKQKVYSDLYGHKSGFLPQRRDLYSNLLKKENNRVAKKEFFESLDDLQTKITLPSDEAINSVDVNELFVKIELRAVFKIQLLFMQWAQTLVHNSVSQFSQFNSNQEKINEIEQQPKETGTDMTMKDHQTVEKNESVIAETSVKDISSTIEFCQEEDVLIDNPQKRLKCLLCGLEGERSITGRLIPFQINQFVHVNCAMWTQEVQEGQEEGDSTRELYNFFFAFKEFKNITCDFCNKKGATIFCSNRGQKRCPAAFHFPCAYASRKVAFLLNTDIYCESCIPKTPEAIAGFPVEFRNYPKRRIIIVSNTEPQCTSAFQNQLKRSQQAQQQLQNQNNQNSKAILKNNQQDSDVNMIDASPSLRNANNQSLLAQNNLNDSGQMGQNSANNNNGDVGVIIQYNKWRPYYYDMFNRVGNLTLLSLSRRRNSIIESLHTFTHENRNWHERFNLRFPEQDQTDFAALRIYWDYTQGKKNEIGTSCSKGPPESKTYFLFNTNKVQEVQRHDYQKVRKYINRRLDEFQKPNLKELTLAQNNQVLGQKQLQVKEKIASFEQFWVQQISNLAIRYPLFCQDNTYLTSKVISGLDKFPVQYWNNPGEKLGQDTKNSGLELKDLGVAGFFYKSGYKSLEAEKIIDSTNLTSQSHLKKIGVSHSVGLISSDKHQGGLAHQHSLNAHMSSNSAQRGREPSLNSSIQAQSAALQAQAPSLLTNTGLSQTGAKDEIMQQSNHRSSGGQHASQIVTSGIQGAGPAAVSAGPMAAARNTSLDSIFKQILEANKVNDQKTSPLIMSLTGNGNRNEDSSDPDSRQDLSTKVMNYEQIMACLGKKTLKVKQEERRKAEEEKARLEQEHQNQMRMEVMYGEGNFQLYPNGINPLDANGKPTNGQGQGAKTSGGEGDNAKDAGHQTNATVDAAHRRKGSKISDINEMINKGNDINAAMKYRAAKERPKLVEVWISKIHRNGLFACQPLNPKDIIIEYVGEKIREPVADKREDLYNKLGVGDCYNFRLDKDYIIDATFYGSKARYINHSCDPNLISEYLTVNGETHIIFVAARKIVQGEELTFDYNFMPEIESIECFCGTNICRGRLA